MNAQLMEYPTNSEYQKPLKTFIEIYNRIGNNHPKIEFL